MRRQLGIASSSHCLGARLGRRRRSCGRGGADGDHRPGRLGRPDFGDGERTVNPGGQATTWHVEYGTSTSYGSQSASASVGSGSANVAVSRTLAGLAAGTTYHYRVVATNGAGTSRGADGIFTTLPRLRWYRRRTGVTPTTATLNGTVDPNGRATTWYFEYGTSTSYGTKTAVKDAGAGRARSTSRRHWRTSPAAGSTTTASSRRATPARAEAPTRPSRRSAPAVTTDAASSVSADVGEAERHDHSERPVDELVLRLRHEHELRDEDLGQERRLGNARHAGERVGDAAADGRHVPLPPRRDQRIRNDGRPRPHLQHRSAARRPHGARRGTRRRRPRP